MMAIDGPIRQRKNFDDKFSCFDTKHACDRWMVRQTDGIGVAYTHYSIYAVVHKKCKNVGLR